MKVRSNRLTLTTKHCFVTHPCRATLEWQGRQAGMAMMVVEVSKETLAPKDPLVGQGNGEKLVSLAHLASTAPLE